MDNLSTFVPLLAATFGMAAWTMLRAIGDPRRLTTFPFVAAAIWLYFYVFMASQGREYLAPLLPSWTLELGQLLAFIAFGAILLGWKWASQPTRHRVERPPPRGSYSANRLWSMGVALILVGGIANYLFISQKEIDWAGSSAYWYLLFHVSYPGLALVLIAQEKGAGRGLAARGAVLASATVSMLPHLVAARRGPLFPLVVVLVFVPALLRTTAPKRAVVLGSLALAGITMLTFVAVRPWIYRDQQATSAFYREGWSDALASLSASAVVVERTRKDTDNEFIYHCAMSGAALEFSQYQYGTTYLSLLTHWVPRSWWPEKPALGAGWFPSAAGLIPLLTGWTMSAGASAGGVAESFAELGWGFVLVWLFVGWLTGRLYREAVEGRDPRYIVAYVGLVCSSHWLISQGIVAAYVPTMIYLIVPLIAFRLARVRQPLAVGRSSGQTRRQKHHGFAIGRRP